MLVKAVGLGSTPQYPCKAGCKVAHDPNAPIMVRGEPQAFRPASLTFFHSLFAGARNPVSKKVEQTPGSCLLTTVAHTHTPSDNLMVSCPTREAPLAFY